MCICVECIWDDNSVKAGVGPTQSIVDCQPCIRTSSKPNHMSGLTAKLRSRLLNITQANPSILKQTKPYVRTNCQTDFAHSTISFYKLNSLRLFLGLNECDINPPFLFYQHFTNLVFFQLISIMISK